MKAMLMLCAVLVIAIPQLATADHIGVYWDATGSSCTLVAGFTTTTAVVHKFSVGAIASRFKIVFPAGTNFFSFNTSYVPVGDLQTGIGVGYGMCLTGQNVIGTLTAILVPGPICVRPADGFPDVTYFNCASVELPATASGAMVGSSCDFGAPCFSVAVESSTWGSVKALYR